MNTNRLHMGTQQFPASHKVDYSFNCDMLMQQKPTMDQLVKQVILRTFNQLETNALRLSTCLWMPSGCAILDITVDTELVHHFSAYRGPHINSEHICPGDSYCRCSTAISRVIMAYLKQIRLNKPKAKTILVTKNEFWPCFQDQKIIADSGIIDVVICDAESILYRPTYIPNYSKCEIEADIDNTIIKEFLYRG